MPLPPSVTLPHKKADVTGNTIFSVAVVFFTYSPHCLLAECHPGKYS
nr:MAG TPA: hypothetical protein [Caudoviricetes sp.]